ncbi:hypothetical protein OK414_29375 [Priestia sp. JV24]|uniref:hypothetical protein n=1 Tax=Priestia TaxID=2800373 RepID=UPI0021D696E9|nr:MULTISPECIES: hypothetical protein [Priestia]MCU7712981.1 hypothetical protein [Priestia megaterium]MCW1049166.1 hypothetical protein [Priestia sp. JV24]
MSYYFLAVPIGLLLYHSIHVLLNKYKFEKKIPRWVSIYAIASIIYIILTSSSLVFELSLRLHLSNSVAAWGGLITALTVLVLMVKYAPKSYAE